MTRSQPWDYFPLFSLYAFTELKEAVKFVKKMTGLQYEPSGNDGSFTLYKSDAGGFGVILLDCDYDHPFERYTLLAHECVHYAQEFARGISSEPLDDETFAYVVQSAMNACIDQIGSEWFDENGKKTKEHEA